MEAGIEAAHLMRRPSNRAPEQISDLVLQDPVGRQPDRIAHLGSKELVDLGLAKAASPRKQRRFAMPRVADDYGLQDRAPAVGTMDVTRPQSAPFQITKLVEHE
jgi:hypothetical protein